MSSSSTRQDTNSLTHLLYLFICEDDKKRCELYSKDKVMAKVNKKLNELKSDFDDLYIDCEEYKKAAIYEVGTKDKATEIAKNLFTTNLPIEEISRVTDLSIEEIKKLQNEADKQ